MEQERHSSLGRILASLSADVTARENGRNTLKEHDHGPHKELQGYSVLFGAFVYDLDAADVDSQPPEVLLDPEAY